MVKNILLVSNSDELNTQLESLNARLNGSFKLHQTDNTGMLKKVREVGPDYILVDSSVLYEEEGRIFQLLKQNNISDRIPVILLTDDPEKDDLFKLFNHGFTDFILKPLNEKELVYRLNLVRKKIWEGKRHFPDENHLPDLDVDAKSSINAVVLMDPEGKVDWVNDGFEQMYGYPFNEYLEKFGHYI